MEQVFFFLKNQLVILEVKKNIYGTWNLKKANQKTQIDGVNKRIDALLKKELANHKITQRRSSRL